MSRRGKWRYSVWCPDCIGIDPEGCFEGKTHVSEERYDTSDAAEIALEEYLDDTNWLGRVIHIPTEELEKSKRKK